MSETGEIHERFQVVLFDMDGTLTTTERLHASAWTEAFDEFLDGWDRHHGTTTPRFTRTEDYRRHVDGKPRDVGARDFLASRGIDLPDGEEDAPPGEWTISGIGNRKQDLVEQALHEVGVEAFPGSVAWVRDLRSHGLATGVVSSSRNAEMVLEAAGIADLFDTVVDGNTAAEAGLPGKPHPDMFLEAARRLGVDPSEAAVVEDAIAGVEAARAGHFGLIIGVDRGEDRSGQLLEHGADVVVTDLGDLLSPSTEADHPAGPRVHRLRAAAVRLLAADEDFPIEEHRLVERRFSPDTAPELETLFAVSNGYLGIRGTPEEGRPTHQTGTLLNGFYLSWPIVYPERAYGFAEHGQTILNVTDGTIIKLYVDDEPFELEDAEVLEYERALDMATGVLHRHVVWRTTDGRRFRIDTRRLVSFEHRHLAAFDYEVTALDGPARLTISSELVTHAGADAGSSEDPRRGRGFEPGVLEPLDCPDADGRAVLAFETRSNGLRMACGMDHHIDLDGGVEPEVTVNHDHARAVFRFDAPVGTTVRISKMVAYHHGPHETPGELCFRVTETLRRALDEGMASIVAAQERRVQAFWDAAAVRLEGAPLIQQAMNFSLFQLYQASGRAEGYGIPAKGLTGQGYEGHYFWDTELYVMPFLVYTMPQVAKNLLRHRYAMLDAARARAREVGHERGALFPWRTINGEEASAYYATSTAQYHINADVAYALVQYLRVTGDLDFLYQCGAEILVETARLWVELGYFSERKDGAFVLNGVTGPDEYSALVDNNAYTNLMARQNLLSAVDAVEWLAGRDPEAYATLVARTGLEHDEAESWRRAAETMYVPYDDEAKVHLQDDGFLDLERWDFEGTPPEHYPLLLHYHPLVLYRHQVIKQADLVLATFLLSDEFTAEEKRRIFEYYDPLTTGDSSLSESIQSIAAAEIGDHRAAEEYFVDAVAVDLADAAGNVRDGIHVASAGGSWLAVVCGFAGMRERDGRLSFRPVLPERVTGIEFKLRVRTCVLEVHLDDDQATYRLREGTHLIIRHWGERLEVTPDGVTLPLGPPEPVEATASA